MTDRVYFVQSGRGGPIKIGWSRRVEARIALLQVGNPAELRLLGTCVGGADRERALHRALAPHWLRGEWFRPTDEVLAVLAASVEEAEEEMRRAVWAPDRRRSLSRPRPEEVMVAETVAEFIVGCVEIDTGREEDQVSVNDVRASLDFWMLIRAFGAPRPEGAEPEQNGDWRAGVPNGLVRDVIVEQMVDAGAWWHAHSKRFRRVRLR